MKGKNSLDVNTILSSTSNLKHILHLYGSDVDKYDIQLPFLAMSKNDEKVVYVTNEVPESIMQELKGLDINLSIISTKKLSELKGKLRIVMDMGSIAEDHLKLEKQISKLHETSSILCTYDITKVDLKIIKELVPHHDMLIFTTGNRTVLSSESLTNVADEVVEHFVKNNLETIVLAMVLRNPMCGNDVIKNIHKKFNVLLSPGTVYPLLHALEKKGLLEWEYRVKKKIYKPIKDSRPEIIGKLKKRVQVSRILNRFLQPTEVDKRW